MKKIIFVALMSLLGLVSMSANSFAGEIEILVQKLVEKDILSPLEAQIILDETKADVAKQIAQGENSALPDWIQKTHLKGDFRLRYQYERREHDTEGRERGRIRYRLGVISNPLSKLEVGAGLASGGSDARSTNETFDDVFSTPDIRLDYAYAQYQLTDDMKIIGGKFPMKNYLWTPTDLLWDGDINPEGGSLNYSRQLSKNLDLFANGGVWYLDHKDQVDETDPFMTYLQTGLKFGNDTIDSTIAGTFYSFDGIKGSTRYTGKYNTADSNGGYKYDYDSGSVGMEVGYTKLVEETPYRIALFGEYVSNPDAEEQNNGWTSGIKFGHKKVSAPGSWQAQYLYAYLGKDAWFESFPDSDRYEGSTNVKSHEAILNYAVKKNLTLGLDYYYSDLIKGTENAEHVIQADMVIKF